MNLFDENCDGMDEIISSTQELGDRKVNIFPNPASDLIVIQVKGLLKRNLEVRVFDSSGRQVLEKQINQGSTISYIDAQTFYNGNYIIQLHDGVYRSHHKIVITKD